MFLFQPHLQNPTCVVHKSTYQPKAFPPLSPIQICQISPQSMPKSLSPLLINRINPITNNISHMFLTTTHNRSLFSDGAPLSRLRGARNRFDGEHQKQQITSD
ncbi:hypothetical protein BLNAU_6889 [Blattamonas nauphoetae]|uniref:Uncharacterized protein n=1 Tax=Blattamonas nauphoetae TaxID=2049346 RepID=A0ABQ9Y369_9EUKA|nr:hypothetical protein BLNAU_6889 [Blattamonas nauphoetae]